MQFFDLLISDLHLDNVQGAQAGLELIRLANDIYPALVIIAISMDFDQRVCEQARKNGALHFLRKPIDHPSELAAAIDLAIEHKRLLQAHSSSNRHKNINKIFNRYPFGVILTPHEEQITNALATRPDVNLILTGETGTGKGQIAEVLFKKRQLLGKVVPFIAVNCATLRPEMMASLMFGHRRGSFTGATENTIGFIGEADGGILFLDEVHTLSLESQQMLLRVLDNGSYQRLGETHSLQSEFQLVVASNKNLNDLVESGSFLLDLYMRLGGFKLNLSPLRSRLDEMDQFIDLFFALHSRELAESFKRELTKKCREYYWQGNIRQLFYQLKYYLLLCDLQGSDLSLDSFPQEKSMFAPDLNVSKKVQLPYKETVQSEVESSEDLNSHIDMQEIMKAWNDSDLSLNDFLYMTEKSYLERILKKHKKVNDAVSALGISRSTLAEKRKKFSL